MHQNDKAANTMSAESNGGGRRVIDITDVGYVLQEEPDREVVIHANGGRRVATPVLTLKDPFGGVAHIVRDDKCYVLVTGSYAHGFTIATHWFQEAIAALVGAAAIVTVRIA